MNTIQSILISSDSIVPLSERRLLLMYVLGLTKLDLIKNPSQEVPSQKSEELNQLISRRRVGEPIAYIIGQKEFYGRDFHVTSDVLIPRPETEQIIEIIKDLEPESTKELKFLDVGTGSGCIALTLAKEFPSSNLTALDISKPALKITQSNQQALNVPNSQFTSIQSDLLEAVSPNQHFDYIIANLPYIDPQDPDVSQETKRFEPGLALFSNKNGLDHYIRLFDQLKEKKITFESIIIEVGHQQKNEVDELIKKSFTKTPIWRYDLQSIPRICII